MDLPSDIVGEILNATDDIRAAACVCVRWAAVATTHPDMLFWRSREQISAGHVINAKLRRAVKTLGLTRVMRHKWYHLICLFNYNPEMVMVGLDFNDDAQLREVKKHVDTATVYNINAHQALLKAYSCVCVMCHIQNGPIMW